MITSLHSANVYFPTQIEENPLVKFLALDLTDPDSIETVLSHIDFIMQYGEDEEPKEVCAVAVLVVRTSILMGAFICRILFSRRAHSYGTAG